MKKIILFFVVLFSVSLFSQPYYWEKIGDFNYVWDLVTNSNGEIFICRQESGGIRKTTNDGNSWEFINIESSNIGNLAINNSDYIFALEEYNLYNAVNKSTDNGNSWNRYSTNGGRIRSLDIGPEGNIYAGNDEGLFFKSTNDGLNWDTITITNVQLNCISSASNGQIFVGTQGKGLFSSTDFGDTWFKPNDFNANISSITINDSDYIFIADFNLVKISKNLGLSWNTVGSFDYTTGVLYNSHDGELFACYNRVYRSTDNGQNWVNLGGPSNITAIKKFGENIYLGTYSGVYRYNPDILPAPFAGKNCFPLNANNKWQYLHLDSWANGDYYNLRYYFVEIDTLINNKNYFKLNTINDLVRFSESDKIIYKRWNDSDYVFVNFNYPPDSTYLALSPYHSMDYVYPLRGDQNIFGKNRIFGGYEYFDSYSYIREVFTDSIGITSDIFSGEFSYDSYKLIEAIIYDTSDIPTYFSEHYKPIINLTPILKINSEELILNFYVNHAYTRLVEPSPFSSGLNFIDTVYMKSYYSKGDTMIQNSDVRAYNNPEPTNINYLISFNVDTLLLINDYKFNYKVVAIDKGLIPESSSAPDTGYFVCIWDSTTSLNENTHTLSRFILSQNYPNPFNPSTSIQYAIASRQFVTLKVYDVLGKEIATLVNEEKPAGNYEVDFNVVQEFFSATASGVYFYQFKAGEYIETKKMILMK
jgi:hypothetical protein